MEHVGDVHWLLPTFHTVYARFGVSHPRRIARSAVLRNAGLCGECWLAGCWPACMEFSDAAHEERVYKETMMNGQSFVTLVHVLKGATPHGDNRDIVGEGKLYCHLPETGGDEEKTRRALKGAGFKLGVALHPHRPEPEEEGHVALVFYAHDEVGGDGGRYYYLPGASYDELVRAMGEAGFKCTNQCDEAFLK